MRRPALIFDFGNVVAHFDYALACDRLARRHGLTGPALLRRLREAGLNPLVGRYESGRISAEDFGEALCDLAGLGELPHEEFAAAWADIFWPNEPVHRLIPFLKERGYTLILGSNTNDLHAAHFRRQFAETLAHFDRLVLSYEVGHIKPAAAFFLACAEAADAPPEDCLFIDDVPENVEGARKAGLSALLYQNYSALLDDLRREGVEIPDTASGPTSC